MKCVPGSKMFDTDPIFHEALAEGGTGGLTLETMRAYLTRHNSIFCVHKGVVVGFIGFVKAIMPDTHEEVVMERFLYVSKKHRGSKAALLLVKCLVQYGQDWNYDAVLAGASLNEEDMETARRLYEHCGFRTNYTFRKELKCATQSPPS